MHVRPAWFAVAVAVLLGPGVEQVRAHSWLECADWKGATDTFKHGDYDVANCKGFPRPLDGGNRGVGRQAFGQDIGMDKQTTRSDASNQCHAERVDAAAYGDYPMAQYEQGGTYTLVWPAKNHAAAECTNANIPDNGLKIFASSVNPTTDPLYSEFQDNQIPATFSDDPHVNGSLDMKGYQKCPDFCTNTDKAFCHGDITIPADMTPGQYTFQWYWEFNTGQIYMTCFEVDVLEAGTGPAAVTSSPTVAGDSPAPVPVPAGPLPPRAPGSTDSACGDDLPPGTNSVDVASAPAQISTDAEFISVWLCYRSQAKYFAVVELKRASSNTHIGYTAAEVDPENTTFGEEAPRKSMLIDVSDKLSVEFDDVILKVWNVDTESYKQWQASPDAVDISSFELSVREYSIEVVYSSARALGGSAAVLASMFLLWAVL